MTTQELITDKQVLDAFLNLDFGNVDYRDVLKFSLLKYASGFVSGNTVKCILWELKLLDQSENLTARGKTYLWAAFNNKNYSY